jgi:hypothetical protein
MTIIPISDLAPFSISGFQRREAPPKPTFTVRARSARTVNAKGARSELSRKSLRLTTTCRSLPIFSSFCPVLWDAIQDSSLPQAQQLLAELTEELPANHLELVKAKLLLRKQELRHANHQ